MRIVSGDQQAAPAGAALVSPLTVLVENPAGVAEPGIRVRFTIARGTAGGSTLADGVGVTDPSGLASTRLTLGSSTDTTWVEAALATVDGVSARFSAVAVPAPTVTSVSATTLRAGDTVRVLGSGFVPGPTVVRIGTTSIPTVGTPSATEVRAVVPPCLAAGAADLSVSVRGAPSNAVAANIVASRAVVQLRAFESVTVPAARLADCIAFSGEPGASYLVTPQFAAGQQAAAFTDWRLGATGTAVPIDGAVQAEQTARVDHGWAQREMERRLRALERDVASQARAESMARSAAGRAALRSTAAPDIGSMRTFSVVAALNGSQFVPVMARLRYVGEHVLVYTDTSTSSLADTSLVTLSNLMDRDLHPVTVNAFGSESDVDGNGRVIVLLTPVVNSLVKSAECAQHGFVTGFFYGVDVLERAEHSNDAEVFYGYVPDSAGRYSCPHAEADVVRILQGTFAHELQHLISFNQHVLARGRDPEETWLNEGLSHIAEELVSKLFEARYPAPLGRASAAQLFPDSAAPFIAPQLLNAYVYLNSTLRHSVTTYEGVGSIEERGATWLFLRWLADQKGEAIFRRLVEAPVTGVANVERASGESFGALFGDFSVALVADSMPGVARAAVPARQRFLSRNLRQLMAREAVISGFTNPFPLPTYTLTPGASLRSSMLPGTMLHAIVRLDAAGTPLRFAFTSPALAPLLPSVGGQVGIMRVP